MRMTLTRRREMLRLLSKDYQGATTGLEFGSSFELLVAVILSAQCTDVRVNIITRRLFPMWNTPAKMLSLSVSQLEDLIHDCGLFRAKAKNILATCKLLQDKWQGEVPGQMEDLLKLPGVGRKTANVVLNMWWHIPAQAVDTHIFRFGNRTGVCPGKDVETVERAIEDHIPAEFQQHAHHWLILHGRYICTARKPRCADCLIRDLCPFEEKTE